MRLEKLSERDYAILKYLAYGPSNIASIGKKFFPLQKNECDMVRQTESAKGVFSKYLYKRMEKLQNAGLLQYKRADLHDSPIVVLQEEGAREIAIRFGFDRDSIRTSFPKRTDLMHDLMVASTIRKMVEEAEEHDLYRIEYLHSAHYAKKSLKKGGRKEEGKRFLFPDFRIRIVPHKGSAYTFDIEIDAGNLGRSMACRKVFSLTNPVLIVAPNSLRLKKLFEYLLTDMKKEPKELRPVYFALWGLFIKNGMRFSDVILFPSGERGRLPVACR
ncbi:MAG: hypothetical protein K8I29_01900 [Alphaproteobacteria bacterium]|uniref:Replication-relaxation n=1 Tax=Candidatus Nitrobium versatile TaxID=2884831 RepID=A0A953LVK1_9BACT|nr:hypothetical protein [Candidatus Nitrobium versatile]